MALEKLTCKSCGSNDFRQEGNHYICNHCGTVHVMTDDGTYNITIKINCGTNQETPVKPIITAPIRRLPDEKIKKESHKMSCLGCFGLIMIISFFFTACIMLLVGEEKVSNNSFKRESTVTDMALLQKEGHPRLLAPRQSVVDFYAGYGNIVTLDKEYNDDTVLHVITYEQDVSKLSWLPEAAEPSSDKPSRQKLVDDIQINFAHMKNRPDVTLEEAVQLANSFMPWTLIDTYYQLSETVSYKESDKTDSDIKYVARYRLKDRYTDSNYEKHGNGPPISIGFSILTDPAGIIKYERIQIFPRVELHRYGEKPWQSPSLHLLPVDESWKSVSWQLLAEAQPPKLLGDYHAMLEFGKKFPVEAVDISCNKESAISYGLRDQRQFFTVDGRTHNDKSHYVFEIKFDFTKLQPEKTVSLTEAVDVMKKFMPYDWLDTYFTLNFSRKISPTNKNTDGSIQYQVVYDRALTDANRADINRLELPQNIQVAIKTDENGNAVNATLNCYMYSRSVKGRSYELLKDQWGEIREIYEAGRELGPYESSNDFHYIEPWESPF